MADRTDLGRVVLYLATDLGSSERDLDGFEKKAKEVGAELNRMIDSLDGTKAKVQAETMIAAIQQVGGVTKLSTDELKTLGAEASSLITKFNQVGNSVPADLQKIADAGKAASKDLSTGFGGMISSLGPLGPALAGAFSIGAIIGFGKEILGDADALMRMSDQTGIGVVALQQLKGIAVESGNDVEQLTTAISQFQKRIAEGDTSAIGAVNRLGLSLDTLKSQAPDQQFLSIARAIAQITDPMERTRAAMELFGKSGAAILPSLRADVDKIIESTSTMSEETVKKLDAAGDAWERFKNRVKVFAAEAIVSTDGEVEAMVRRINKLKEIQDGALPDTMGLQLGAPKMPTNAAATVPGMPSAAVMEQSEFAAGVLSKKLAELAAEQKRLAAETKKSEDAQRRFLDSIHSLTTDTIGARKGLGEFGLLFAQNTGRGEAFANVIEGLNEDGTLVSATFKDFGVKLQDVGLKQGVLQKQIEKTRASTRDWRNDLSALDQAFGALAAGTDGTFGEIVREIAQVVHGFEQATRAVDQYEQATTNAGKAAALLQGAAALAGATTPHPNTTVDPNTGTIKVKENRAATVAGGAAAGAELGSIAGPWGMVIGGGIGALIGWIRSGTAEKEVNKFRQAFVDSAGGLDALNKHAHDSGVTLDALLNAKGPEDYNKAITDLNKAMAAYDAKVKRVSDGVSTLSDAWSAAGDDIPADIKASIDELRTMNGLTDDQKKALDQMSAAAEPDYKKLTDLAGNYGISLDALGPKFQQANIDSTAEDIFKAFDKITRAGGDVGGVLSGMSDEISKLVDDSLKYGTTIPDNMKPLIEELSKAGKLTDDAGNAITDISQIKFGATPLDKSTSAIVDAVHELRDALLELPANAALAAKGMKDAFGNPLTGGTTSGSIPGGSRPADMIGASYFRAVARPALNFSRGDGSGNPSRPAALQDATLHVHLEQNGRETARAVLPHLYDQARLLGVVGR